MKKLIAIVVLVVVGLAAVAYRMGWLAKVGIGSPGAPSSVTGAQGPGSPTQQGAANAAAPGASPTTGEPGASGAATSQGAGEPTAAGAPAAAPIPAPTFSGNIALIDFGGTVERTSANYGDSVDHSAIIDGNPDTAWRNHGSSASVGEVVLSFFGRETMLIDAVAVKCDEETEEFPRDVEVWVSTAANADGPFTKVASASLPKAKEAWLPFVPVEARFLKFRMLKNHVSEEQFRVTELQVHEAQRLGYVPLMTRHPELGLAGGPVPLPGGMPVVSTTLPPCKPAVDETAEKPAHNSSTRVLVVGSGKDNYKAAKILESAADKRLDDGVPASDLAILSRARITQTTPEGARPAMLAPALGDALLVAAIEKYPYTVYAAAGKVVASGEAGASPEQLPAGEYKVVVKAGSQELVASRVTLALGQSVTLRIAMKGNRLVLE